jgi:hypothetical protein
MQLRVPSKAVRLCARRPSICVECFATGAARRSPACACRGVSGRRAWRSPARPLGRRYGLVFKRCLHMRLLASDQLGRRPMMATRAYRFIAVDEGYVAFECEPGELINNPSGSVNAGAISTRANHRETAGPTGAGGRRGHCPRRPWLRSPVTIGIARSGRSPLPRGGRWPKGPRHARACDCPCLLR